MSAFLLILAFLSLGFRGDEKNNKIKKVSTNDDYQYIAINQILMWVANNGDGSHDPVTDANGFYWPGGLQNTGKSAIFEDGLVFAGKVGREIRMNGNTHRQGLQAGKILPSGEADNPGLEKYRVYKIRKGWELLPPGPVRDAYEKDYNEWPVEDGAPYVDVDGDGLPSAGDTPYFIGDEVLWYVANDLDPNRATFTYGTLPMGLEFQTTIFGFQRTGPLGDMVFKKYRIVNKGTTTIRDMILGYWSDTDMGDANDDYTGCDTALSLGYTWNASNNDGTYGTPPPAVGYDFFQGPVVPAGALDSAKFDGKWIKGKRNLPMTAFTFYLNGIDPRFVDPQQGVPAGAIEFYNYLSGKVWNGDPFIDPNTNDTVKIILAGDPVAKTGWYEGGGFPGGPPPGDRRHVMGSGPFTMVPGDTQEIVVGLVIGVGASNLNSITVLKEKDIAAQIAYDLDFNLTPAPPSPNLTAVPGDRKITLTWEMNAESYHAFDPIIPDTIRLNVNGNVIVFPVGTNKYYDFEGYQVWQFKDIAGTEPKLLATFDKTNGIIEIRNFQYDSIFVNGGHQNVEPYITGNDEGLRRHYVISSDAYSNGPLYNANPYYFAVTAYGFSRFSDPPILESTPAIIEVLPSTDKIDAFYSYPDGSNIDLQQTVGVTDARVRFKVLNQDELTGHTYNVKFYKNSGDTLAYMLIDKTTGDTLLTNQTSYGANTPITAGDATPHPVDTLHNPVVDGFTLIVENTGKDSLDFKTTKYGVKGIYEVKGPGGVEMSDPINVYRNLNSTGKWSVVAKSSNQSLIFQATQAKEGLGYNNYELRFTDSSYFFATGYQIGFVPVIKKDTLSKIAKVPFQVFNTGRLPNDTTHQLMVKVLDNSRIDPTLAIPNHKWSHLSNDSWEQIFAYTAPFDVQNPPDISPLSLEEDFNFGSLAFVGEIPEKGTVIRIEAWKPIVAGDEFAGTAIAPKLSDPETGKVNVNNISVFPNPYFGSNNLERDKYQRFMRFTNLPTNITIRIFSLAGVFIQRIEKNDNNPYIDWNLRNKDGLPVASGVYLAYLDMPGVGTKVMKLAVIMETQYIDRL